MTGIALIVFIWIWASIAVLLGKKLSKLKLCTRLTTNATTGEPTIWHTPVKFLLIIFVFLLPLADEIISYPRYYMMCRDAGKYQFASGMDAKRVFGRSYRINVENENLIRLFPNFRELSSNDDKNYGVVIRHAKLKLVDVNTNEILLTSYIAVPLRSFFAIPWDGKRIPWLLRECTTQVGKNGARSQEFIRKLQLHPTYY